MNFGAWDKSIHKDGEQLKRIATAKNADTTPATVDRENKSAKFKGSGAIPYTTTLEKCSCRDFAVRGLPCKHIYRLALELCGGDVVQGVNKNEYAEPPNDIFTLLAGSQEMLYDMCDALTQGCENAFIYERNEYAVSLLHNGFCVETVLTLDTLKALPVAKIKRILSIALSDREDLPKKAAQRKSCVAWLELHFDSVSKIIDDNVIFLECTEHTEKLKRTIKRRYEKRFKRVVNDYGDGMTSESFEKLFIQE